MGTIIVAIYFPKFLIPVIITILVVKLLIGINLFLWLKRISKYLKRMEKRIANYAVNHEEASLPPISTPLPEFKRFVETLYDAAEMLRSQDEYKNQIFQSISHDFKTPLAVIQSHLEALDDGMLTDEEFKSVVRTQIHKVEYKVNSLLYLNKLNYLSDLEIYKTEEVDLKPLIDEGVAKFKFLRPEVTFNIVITGDSVFRGTVDAWEAIIDNLLNNFMRYAEKTIKITVKDKRIIFYNDGPKIDENVLNDIFSPYKKGLSGLFGIGLSIVKRTISMLGYEITVKNEKKGVNFIIY